MNVGLSRIKQRVSSIDVSSFRKAVCVLSGLSVLAAIGCTIGVQNPTNDVALPQVRFQSFAENIQPILNRRCAVCHSCNDSPCQLDQGSFAGVDRGASTADVYANRLVSAQPTRLFIDAQTTPEWRARGFFPVIQHYPPGDERNLTDSILYQLVSYRKFNPLPKIRFDSFSSRECPNLNGNLGRLTTRVASLVNLNPHADLGMPYGFPPLSDTDYATLREWMSQGAPGPDIAPGTLDQSAQHRQAVSRWEQFFNGSSPREKLVSRYLYEHLFYAHLHFSDDIGEPVFYRLVRSRTAAPEPISEIATRLPYDAPTTSEFFYRLRPIESAIVGKTHLVFSLTPHRLARLKAQFLGSDWQMTAEELPAYDPAVAANPFVTFRKIPPSARYQFMLDNAEYLVESFMKGPACRGQIALNVIDDHFFIFFLDPKADQSIVAPSFFDRNANHLVTPFRPGDLFTTQAPLTRESLLDLPFQALKQLKRTFYPFYKDQQLKYLKERDSFYQQARPSGFSLEDVWDGDGVNSSAVLTVFRHYDSASVTRGAIGGEPRTSLMLDYPIFERMYYDLVASFDIFSDIKLQLAARLYMDDLRIEAEDLFLSFLPLDKRAATRRAWYKKAESSIDGGSYPFYGTTSGHPRDTLVKFSGGSNPKAELIETILNRRMSTMVRGNLDILNSQRSQSLEAVGPISGRQDLERELAKIGGKTGEFVWPMPDLAFVRFALDSKQTKYQVYTFVRNREHFNVKYLYSEDARLNRAADTLSVIQGFHGYYPNFFFDVPYGEAQQYLDALQQLNEKGDSFSRFVDRFGIRRTNPRFWEFSDWFNEAAHRADPIRSGLFDLNRYENY
ncbi:MAG: fatty acid cis/trans isomerase [Bdellovibrionota bacterium]